MHFNHCLQLVRSNSIKRSSDDGLAYSFENLTRWEGAGGRWTSDLKVGGSTPSPCHRVVSIDEKPYPTLSLSTQVY